MLFIFYFSAVGVLGHGGPPPPNEEHGDGFQAEAEAGEGRGGAGEDRGDACEAVPPLRMRSTATG